MLKDKYLKLSHDLQDAATQAIAEYGDSEDGGTCNFDAPALVLPRWNESLVIEAAAHAGVGCFAWKAYGGRLFVFSPRCGGQGNMRTRVAERMRDLLKERGYDVFMYYQMD